MAEGGDGVGGTVGTSARNRLARRGSNAKLLLWVSSNQQGSGGALGAKKSRLLQRQPTMSELGIVRWTAWFQEGRVLKVESKDQWDSKP